MSLHPVSNLRTRLQRVLVAASLCLVALSQLPAAVYRESFNYPNGTVLVPSDTSNELGIGSWRRHDGTGNGAGSWIKVNNGAVNYGGVNAQDIFMAIGSSGTINYPFPIAASSPGPIYFAFDVNISAATATGDYFMAIATNAAAVRAGIRARTAPGGYVFGYGGTNTTYDTTVRSFGTTYRVVLRYNMIGGTLNNPGTLYVLPPDLAGVDTAVEANNTPVIAGFIAGTDWDTGIPGPLLNQSTSSPTVSSFSNLVIASNFPEAVGGVAFTPLPAAPTFSPAAGTYPVAQNVTITSGTSGATIRYTTDGSNPSTTAGTVYSGPVTIAAATSLKAIAYTDTTTKSPVSTASYIINVPQVSTPTFGPVAGNYTTAQSVTIATSTTGSTIRYTTDGSDPTPTTGTVYAGPVAVASTMTVKAIAFKSGAADSAIASAAYTISAPPVSAPVFSPVGGTYTSAQSVTLTSATPGASIRYTTDGSSPTSASGTIYAGPVPVGSTTTLKAIAYQSGVPDSAVSSAAYTINIASQAAAPVFSPPGGNYATAQSVTLASATEGATIRYTTDGSSPTSTVGAIYAGPIPVGTTTTTLKAVAYLSGLADSAVASATYTFNPTASSFGPNGTHWPELLPTPFLYDTSVPHVIDVDCTWTAIRNALAAVTPAQAAAGVLIRVAPGALPGNGSGSTSTPVLQNLGSTAWTKRVTVAPRDGYGTVTIGIVNSLGARIHNVHGVCFAGFVAYALRPSACINSAIAWTKVTFWLGVSAATNLNSSNMELVEVVMPNASVRDTDTAESATSTNGTTSNFRFTGCYFAPSYRSNGSAHTDTFQFFGSSAYSNMVFKDTVLFSSSNCAIQTGDLDGLQIIHCYIAAEAPALSRYPFPSGYTPPNPLDVTKTFNGGGGNFQVYDSIFIGRMPYSTSPWSVVSNTRITEAVSLAPGATGAWTVDPTLATSTPEDFNIPVPTDAYLAGIWGGTVVAPLPASVSLGDLQQTYSGNPLAVTVVTNPAGLPVAVTYDASAVVPVNAGSYAVVATVSDPAYVGSASGTLVINPAPAAVTLGNLIHTYDGSAKSAAVATSPTGVATTVTYDGGAALPVNAGTYSVVATVAGANYSGPAATGTLTIAPAAAEVSLGALTQVYSGSPLAATATTNPGGLAVQLTYNGSATAPTNAGSYAVVATINEVNYTGSASGTLVIGKAGAAVTLSNLASVYSGSPSVATATTNPAGLSLQFTYDGSAAAPVNAGSYAVVATIADPNYSGAANGTLVIGKAGADVTLGELAQVYDGSARAVTATTAPADLGVQFTYDGSAAAPVNAGSYAVVATVTDANYTGSAAGTLVVTPASATVTLGDLTQRYDGTPKAVSTETDPTGLTVVVTYDGSATAPTSPGAYVVVATVNDANYTGSATGTLHIGVTALVRHLENLNGGIDGSVQALAAEDVTLNGSAWISGDLLVPGEPTVKLNGQPSYQGTLEGSGAAMPVGYTVTLNGKAVLRHVVRRTDAITLPVVAAPPLPTGTRTVSLNSAGQSPGDFATLRNLTLNGNAGQVAVPAGTYGSLTANGSSSFVLGVAGATSPAVYNLQSLTLNGSSRITIAGPVIINLANGTSLNGSVGNPANPEWLELNIANGGLTLNGNVVFDGYLTAPTGTVTINGNAVLNGGVIADRLTINGSGALLKVDD
jgi:hypothetical protein